MLRCQKRLLLRKTIKSNEWNYSRLFCTIQQNIAVNTEETSDDNDTLRLVKQRELLDDANVQRKWDVNQERRMRLYRQRITAKLDKSRQRGNYPMILQSINEAQSGDRIIELVTDHIEKNPQHKRTVLDLMNSFAADSKSEMIASDSTESSSDSDGNQQSNEPMIRNPAVITHGMRACFYLNQFESGWKLYAMARGMNCVSNDLYSMALFGKMMESPSIESLTECFTMFNEWREEEKSDGLHITAKIYSSLIAACLKINNYGKGFFVFNKLILEDLSKEQLEKTMISSSLRQEVINLYCKARGVNEAIQFMSDCKSKYGALPTQNMIATLIAQCAQEVRSNPHLLDIAELLFRTAFDVSSERKQNDAVEMSVFSSLMQVYCKVGDYKSCMDLLKQMDAEENSFPSPTIHCISPCIKAISIHNLMMEKKAKNGEEKSSDEQRLSESEKWKLIDEIVEIQKKHSIRNDVITYSVLFHSCNGDRDKLQSLYKQMINVDKLRPNQMALQNMLLGGLDAFIREIEADREVDNEQDISEWIDWCLTELGKYKLSVSSTFRYRLNTKLSIMKEVRDGTR